MQLEIMNELLQNRLKIIYLLMNCLIIFANHKINGITLKNMGAKFLKGIGFVCI
jgi:hypothetical protein